MVAVIIGGSGSGKSEYAESMAVGYEETQLVYIATMMPFDKESIKRVERHQKMRQEKHFTTKECYTDLENVIISPKTTVLLECMSNLVANEMFSDTGIYASAFNDKNPLVSVKLGIESLISQADNLIIVSNNVFEDGNQYDSETMEYLKILGEINQWISSIADQVIEVVHGIPIISPTQVSR